MDRIREARRSTMAANGLTRRRHRTNSLRDSPDEDGAIEMQEPTRLRDRGSGKKDRDRERERERDRLGRNKRRRGDRLMHGVREDGGEDTSEESINDEEDDDDEDGGGAGGGGGGGGGSVRMLPLNPSTLTSSSSLTNHHRKSFPPAKVFRPTPPLTWKAADEMIGVSVPRKARSVSTKRSHECWASSSGGIVAEHNHRQPSSSPVRAAAAPPSPSSSNASFRKKIKTNGGGGGGGGGGPKFRPPKSASKSSSSVQEEIEIEIAEVLYGMMRQPQSQVPSKQEMNDSIKLDSRETNNNKSSASDGKSRISSPPQNSSSSATPVSAVTAPKRKRPRPVKHEEESPAIFSVRSSPVSSISKAENDQPSKTETCSSNSDKYNQGSVHENLGNLVPVPVQATPEPIKPESNTSVDAKVLTEESEKQDVGLSKDVVPPVSPKKESSVLQAVDDVRDDVKATKANSTISESENQLKEKFQIDLMAPPPLLRSSPERVVESNSFVEAEKVKLVMNEDQKSQRINKDVIVELDKVKTKAEDTESHKATTTLQKERGIDLQLELDKTDRVDANGNGNGNIPNKKQHQNVQRHQHQMQQQQTTSEKNVQTNSLPIPMNVPNWPGGLPSMGYMTPLQGVVSMDGATIPSAAIQPPHLLFNQPRPKKCATHCYIARNILYNQQIARMTPFWPAAAAAGSASLYGANPSGNLSVVPSKELHSGNVSGRATNSSQDKGHGLTMFPGHVGKDKGSSQPSNVDNSSRKQILLQQTLPPHGPTFIFPLNQQQAAAAAVATSVRPGSVKSLPVTSNGPPSSAPNSAPPNTSGAGAAAALPPTMSFTYPNMPGNEAPQYMAILQNNAYPFPIPAHVGGPPGYRGNPAQAFPFFNGSFYHSQMIHPSQIQTQQLPAQSQQSQQGHPNTTISTGSSSSQKHAQNQQQKANNASGSNGGSGSLQGFPVTKNPPSQILQMQQQQQRQQLHNHHASNASRQVESEMGCEDSPSTADSRLNRSTVNIYGPNFAMPMQTPNFALMTPAMSGPGSNGNHSEKKQQQQHPGSKAGGETSPAFVMPFASINGGTGATGLDLSSIAQNHSIMQSSHNYQIMAAQAASAQLKKSYHAAEEGKHVVNSSNLEEDRKAMSGKIPATVAQSIAFTRPDVADPSMSSLACNNVIDSSGRSLNLGSASSRASASVMPSAINTNTASSQQQMQRNQQQILQLQKQNQFAAAAVAASRSKTPTTSNGSIYSDNIPSTSSISAKFPNAVSTFPQSLVQSSNTVVTQSPQWKNSARVTNTSLSPQTMASPPPSSIKTPPQQQSRSQQGQTQISFAANSKSSTQVQTASSTQSPSPPVMVGSPTNSSMSKNTGSPRTTNSTSTNNKTSQTSSLSSQQAKHSPMPTRKSSPVPSILSGPQITPSSNTGSKSQLSQQQQKQQQQHQQHQQQQIAKQNLQHAQLYFSNPYMHSQVAQSNSPTSTTAAATGYYLQRRGPEQVQRQGSGGTSSNGAAANNSKGSTLNTQGLLHPSQFATMPPSGNHHQFVPAGFYVQPVPTAVQVKPAEQKQPAGE